MVVLCVFCECLGEVVGEWGVCDEEFVLFVVEGVVYMGECLYELCIFKWVI